MKHFINTWNTLPSNKKRWVIGVTFVLSILILLFYFLQPLTNKKNSLYTQIGVNKNNLSTINKNTQEIKQLKENKNISTTSKSSQSISEIIDVSTKKYSLKINRFQPDGDNSAQIWLEDAQFKDVINWINDVENNHNLNVATASITATNKQFSGLVSTRLKVNR